MGTRCLVNIKGESWGLSDPEVFATIYRQFDGNPEGMGFDIKSALEGRSIVNGYTDANSQLNGAGCAAAFLVGALKKGQCGNVYLCKAGTKSVGEEYIYTLTIAAGKPVIMKVETVYDDSPLFDGPIGDFDPHNLEESD